jgi:hypothetical protein
VKGKQWPCLFTVKKQNNNLFKLSSIDISSKVMWKAPTPSASLGLFKTAFVYKSQLSKKTPFYQNLRFWRKKLFLNWCTPRLLRCRLQVHFCQSKSEVGDWPPTKQSFLKKALPLPFPPFSPSLFNLLRRLKSTTEGRVHFCKSKSEVSGKG